MTAKTLAAIIGLLFIAVGILGFVNNPIVGDSDNALFHTDRVHNIVHLASGVLFLLFAMATTATARSFMIIFGFIYLALGVLGLVQFGTTGMGTLLGFLHVNGADNLLHLALGVFIILAAAVSKRQLMVA